jgi:hypothetical protein
MSDTLGLSHAVRFRRQGREQVRQSEKFGPRDLIPTLCRRPRRTVLPAVHGGERDANPIEDDKIYLEDGNQVVFRTVFSDTVGLLDYIEILGVERFGEFHLTLRLVVKTAP